MPRLAFLLLVVSGFFLTACPAPGVPTTTDITAFSASPSVIAVGEASTLSWTVAGDDVTLTIDNGVGTVTDTSATVTPAQTTAYTLTATGNGVSDTATVLIRVTPKLEPPTITAFSASPSAIVAGESATLSWSVTGEDVALFISNDVGPVIGTEQTVSPTETTEYTLTATNRAGSDTATVSVAVDIPPFIESTFDNAGVDGWAVTSATISNPGEGGSGSGGGNGFIEVDLPTNGVTSYYVAPAKFRTNWLNYDELSLDLYSSGGDYYTGDPPNRGDIYLANGSLTAQRLLPNRPDAEWERFTVPLADDGGWTLGGGATSLEDVLRRVTSFQVRAEYGLGRDTSGLDNVRVFSRD